MRNTDTTAARDERVKHRQIELLDVRELRALLAYLVRGSTSDQLEELLESRRWRGQL